MKAADLNIGMIGLDTSHVIAFAELLHLEDHPYHVPGGRIVYAYPGGSKDFELSASRVEPFTQTLASQFGVRMLDSIEAVAEARDAILLESVDGRVHLEQFLKIVPYGKPVFIDKPFALSLKAAETIIEAAAKHGTRLLSCSSVRFAEGLTAELGREDEAPIIGADCYGPMNLEPTQPGLFWYGIHAADMLYAVMGRGCREVRAVASGLHESVTGIWEDGRIGTIRGNRCGNSRFGALVHRSTHSIWADVQAYGKPYYASMLEKIIAMFRGGPCPIDPEETLEIIAFIEAANASRDSGQPVRL
ncbi:MAG: Gfo/Idh/MocA family oxidoreductase [Paenibacillus sp.]|uniref:Gfo/Idh/MocA family protein n=1 Tax=Paenibacillus sp. TaxID=58172 RepID=UPI002903CC3D|nr:Gfo/Idh/MocA family oxidoreductase [Paenibacillus sp.]MDU2242563.1 Gfo/Idh/MocA family oxidoreductase [Paenibacillus sp.]